MQGGNCCNIATSFKILTFEGELKYLVIDGKVQLAFFGIKLDSDGIAWAITFSKLGTIFIGVISEFSGTEEGISIFGI